MLAVKKEMVSLGNKKQFTKNITLLLNRAVTYTFSEKTHINGFRLIVDNDLDCEYTEGNSRIKQLHCM